MTVEALKSKQVTKACQDGSREFISLLACICGDSTALPPALIYKSESFDLQDSWVEDFKEGNEAYFATSKNGWSCDAIGLLWLEKVFHRHTKDKAGNRRRLLIVDRHSSHVNMKFIELVDSLQILILIMLPYSTHRLQPLDVGLFSPLSTAYSKEVNFFLHNSQGESRISKRLFWRLFSPAWKASFTPSNIESAFEKTGIFPINSSWVITILEIKDTPDVQEAPKTPQNCHEVRRLHRSFKLQPTKEKFALILRTNERFAAQHSIDEHEKRDLQEALKIEKQKRKHIKTLNLLSEIGGGLNSSLQAVYSMQRPSRKPKWLRSKKKKTLLRL